MEKYTLLLVLISIAARSIGQESESDQVVYYENLIETNQNAAFHYNSPTNADEYRPKTNASPIDYGTFDFIVVGAGAAGSVIASRLSEVKTWSVLLLEAGGPETDFSDIPAMYAYLQGSDLNWAFKTVPQNHSCGGMVNQTCLYPRGKVLGGSTVLNTIIYSRGNKYDFDKWADLGNPGWSYKDVLPLFKKSEHSTINGDLGYHGENGTFNVEYHDYYNEQVGAFFQANKELNVPILRDYNGEHQLGASLTQFNSIRGRRQSSYEAFIKSVSNRPNLKVLTRSYVVKLLINRAKEVEGVLFTKNGTSYVVKASQEVILSAGSIKSPHILMVSGIGPAEELQKFKIRVIQDLSVGKHLLDHPAYYGNYFVTNFTQTTQSLKTYVKQYLKGKGPLIMPGNIQTLGFYQFNKSHEAYPDIELLIWYANDSSSYLQKSFGYTDDTYHAIFDNLDIRRSFLIEVILLHPKSVGKISLKSSDPYDYPVIDSNFLSDPDDVEMILNGIKMAFKLANTEAFQKINTVPHYMPLPPCKHIKFLTEEYLHCAIKQLTYNLFHPIGTCKMGPDPKNGAVVNSKLKVYGIKKLRVADASIMPSTTSGHTSAPSIMIGERVSSFIIAEKLKEQKHSG